MISPFAPVKDVKLILDRTKRFCKGFGHVEFYNKQDQQLVLKQKFSLEGRDLFMEPFFEGNKLKNKSKVFLARRIFISNIPKDATDSELTNVFS